jgi:hypothetical protein
VPAQVGFQTKPQLAQALLERALDAAVPAGWVTADEVYGGDTRLRAWLEERDPAYVLAVKATQPLWAHGAQGPAEVPARRLVAGLPARAWRRLSAGDGAKGPRVYDWARVALTRPGWPGRGFWLRARRRLTDGELACYACFGPARTSLAELVQVAGVRWAVEECFQAAKDQVGLDHYQVRRWDAWYRHVTWSWSPRGSWRRSAPKPLPPPGPARGAADRAEPPQPPRSDLVRVSTAEARRLLVGLVWWTPPTVRQVLGWSRWRRRHQARARRCHWRRRTQRLAELATATVA